MIQVFDDIEKGKLRDIDFLECYACWGGCAMATSRSTMST